MFRFFVIICCTLFQFNLHAQKKQAIIEKGKASFYADKFEGKRTANGEIYHHKNFTAAHKSLPFGTWVKVVNKDNKKSVIVRINDRGPFVKGRIIDLSKSAIKEIGNINQGVFSVSIQVYQKDREMIPIQNILNPIPSKGKIYLSKLRCSAPEIIKSQHDYYKNCATLSLKKFNQPKNHT